MPTTHWRPWANIGRPGGGVRPGGLRAIDTGSGGLAISAIGSDSRLYLKSWDTHSLSASAKPWLDTGGKSVIRHASVVADGTLHLLITCATGKIFWHRLIITDVGAFQAKGGWRPAGGAELADVSAISWDGWRVDVFTCNLAGELAQMWQGSDASYQDSSAPGVWQTIASELRDQPTVVSWGPRRLDLFANNDTRLAHKWWDDAPDRFDVFSMDSENRGGHKWWYPGTGWLPAGLREWEDLGGSITSTPAVVSWAAYHLDVFARGFNGHLWHRWWDPETGWQPDSPIWEDMGGVLAGPPVALSWAPDCLGVFARSIDDTIIYKYRDPGINWRPSLRRWYMLDRLDKGGFMDMPVPVAATTGSIYVFVLDERGTVYCTATN